MDRRTPTPSVAETVAVGIDAAGDSEISQITSSSVADEGRFVPGTLLGGRYRIIGLLGRGGMGEVYRATDLTLGQSVALKFLPEEASQNPRLLERFHGEVRVARMVSHPNVCRVYDIGQIEGMPFISMEYVDGEDLASLLTRIGRLPADKALETARKLCAGLAAAHDRGVIHRDLKPQNIMMNKRGEVVIMDFGLAAIVDQLSGAEVRNGTPAYMAPEQLKGSGVTSRSDIYALGTVFYELFTGKRPYDATNLQGLIDLQESAQLTSMTSIAADIDPAVEKVIRRCLDPDPLKRPSSALAVSAALPGGDALAVALAAGETPSPEMVASHGKTEGLALRYSIPCLVLVAFCLFWSTYAKQQRYAMMHAPLDSPPEVLAHRSREIAASFGYNARPADSAVWMEHRSDLLEHMGSDFPKPRKWDEWLAADAPIQAVYRESPRALFASPSGEVSAENPPPTLPGMVAVTLDGEGHLLDFAAVPNGDSPPVPQPVTSDAVFRAAGLDQSRFKETAPTLVPPYAADEIHEWNGPHPVLPNTQLTVQAASWKGRITKASVVYPWQVSRATVAAKPTWTARILDVAGFVLPGAAILVGLLLARRNWKLGRTDKRGALRLAAARTGLAMVAWLGVMHPVTNGDMLQLLGNSAPDWFMSGAAIWLLYLALEPAVRARWPHSIVTWNRLLAGRFLDAQVSAHILIGAAVGCGSWLLITLLALINRNQLLVKGGNLKFLLGTREWVGGHAAYVANAVTVGLGICFVIFLMRRLLRKDILAAVATAILLTLLDGEAARSGQWQEALVYVGLFSVLTFVLLRFGLVTIMSAVFFLNAFNAILLGADWKAWYAPAGLATLVLMLSLAVFAFWRSLGSRELLGAEDAHS